MNIALKHRWIVFFLILCIGIILRFYKLGEIPSGFHADEAAFGYNAYSILQTGKDEYGNSFPLILKSFGDYKGALYSYFTIPFIAFFGLTEWAVRIPTALCGVCMVALVYGLTRIITRRVDIALLAMFFAAVGSMSVLLSRVQSDPFVSVFFTVLGIYGFFLWAEKKKYRYLILCLFSWVIGMFINTLPRLFLPVFFPLLLWWEKDRVWRFHKREIVAACLVVYVSVLALFINASTVRLGQISVFHTKEVILPLEEKIREDGVAHAPFIATRVFHNKPVEYMRYLAHAWSQYLSFDFLFYGSGEPKRERIPDMGVLLFVQLPFFIIGCYKIIRKRIKWGICCILWVILVPILLSFASDETPNIHRFFLADIPIILIVSYGILESFVYVKGIWKKVAIIVLVGLVVGNIWYFMHQLFVHQPYHFPFYRDYAYKPLVAALQRHISEYEQVVVTKGYGTPYIHILFHWPYDPKKYQSEGSPRDLDDTGFDKYIFVPHSCPSLSKKYVSMFLGKKTMFVDKAECHVDSDDILETVYWKDGTAAFYLTEPMYDQEDVKELL